MTGKKVKYYRGHDMTTQRGAGADENALYDLAIARWGKPAQFLMVIEECSELIKAVCDRLRERVATDAYLMDEMADVKIMLAQLERMVDPVELERIRQAKLDRLRRRLGATTDITIDVKLGFQKDLSAEDHG